jgi:hypothetical protein
MKIPFLLAALLAAPLAHAHKHVHGEGMLDVVIDKGTISISLEMPLDAAVGFERAPKNDKEKAALAEAEKVLKDAVALFVPTPAAKCLPSKVEVGMPKFEGGEHADLDAEYVFTCAEPAALKSMETTIFTQFQRLYRLEVQRAGPNGQGATRLTPKKPTLAW